MDNFVRLWQDELPTISTFDNRSQSSGVRTTEKAISRHGLFNILIYVGGKGKDMSTEQQKQAYLEESLYQLSACAANFGIDMARLGGFQNLTVKCLQRAFRNGCEEGYRRALGNMQQPKNQ